jgi:hypothetical protein
MGVGLIVVCAAADVDRVLDGLHKNGCATAGVLGSIVPGERDVRYVS